MKILVVDDEEFVHLAVAVMLARAAGFELQFARDGDEALRRVSERGPFDVVLTDYYHPGLDGLELAKALREKNPSQGIAMFTGGVPESVEQSCSDLHIPILSKLTDGDDLPAALKKLRKGTTMPPGKKSK